jgi:hypothetical protein
MMRDWKGYFIALHGDTAPHSAPFAPEQNYSLRESLQPNSKKVGRSMSKETNLELTSPTEKRSRDEAIALKHLTRQRDKLIARRTAITKTIEKLDASILPLE